MNGRGASSTSKAIIENDLIEEHHWLPQDIAKIPYRSLQMMYVVQRSKNQARQAKQGLDALRQDQKNKSQASGKRRR